MAPWVRGTWASLLAEGRDCAGVDLSLCVSVCDLKVVCTVCLGGSVVEGRVVPLQLLLSARTLLVFLFAALIFTAV